MGGNKILGTRVLGRDKASLVSTAPLFYYICDVGNMIIGSIDKKMRIKKWLIIIIVIITFTNLPYVSPMIELFTGDECFRYSNGDATCTAVCCAFKDKPYPYFKILSLTKVDTTYQNETKPLGAELRNIYPNGDTVMYRLFKKNLLKFWEWRAFIVDDPKYKFPYKSWEEIKARRPKDFKLNSEWQQF